MVISQVNLNLQVGFMRYQDPQMADPIFEKFTMKLNPQDLKVGSNPDLYQLWGQFFSPVGAAER
jgi:hypothetical protein